jgi:hypothetical protein
LISVADSRLFPGCNSFPNRLAAPKLYNILACLI